MVQAKAYLIAIGNDAARVDQMRRQHVIGHSIESISRCSSFPRELLLHAEISSLTSYSRAFRLDKWEESISNPTASIGALAQYWKTYPNRVFGRVTLGSWSLTLLLEVSSIQSSNVLSFSCK